MLSAVKNANESQVDICIPKLVIGTYGKDLNLEKSNYSWSCLSYKAISIVREAV